MPSSFLRAVLWVLLLGAATFAAEAENIPQTKSSSVSSVPGIYKLSPNDLIQVKVYQEDDLETQARIAQDGSVNLPLIGVVNIGGKSVEEAAAAVKALYETDYLVNAQVNLAIVEYSKRRFTVLGHVQKPGSFEIPSEETLTLVQAIAIAGGYTRIGSPSKVTVQRKENGETKIFKLDANAMAKDENAKPFQILPEDTITVGEKWL